MLWFTYLTAFLLLAFFTVFHSCWALHKCYILQKFFLDPSLCPHIYICMFLSQSSHLFAFIHLVIFLEHVFLWDHDCAFAHVSFQVLKYSRYLVNIGICLCVNWVRKTRHEGRGAERKKKSFLNLRTCDPNQILIKCLGGSPS